MKLLPVFAILYALALTACAAATDPSPAPRGELTGRDWTLVELNGQAVTARRPAHIALDADTQRYSGSGGCNAISGTFALDPGNRIRFSPGIHTMMACPAGTDVEGAFLQALARTDSYSVKGNTLTLEKIDAGIVARLEAR